MLAKGLSAARKRAVLEFLREFPNKRACARTLNIPRSSIRRWEAADPEFHTECEAAVAEGVEALEAEMIRRGKEGVEEYVVSHGKVVIWDGKPLVRRQYSDQLLIKVMEAHDPGRYRNRQSVDLNVSHDPSQLTDAQLAAIATSGGATDPPAPASEG